MKALCAAAPECAVTELDIQGASSSDYLKAMHSCLDVQNCVGITSWGITDNTVSFDIFSPKNGPKMILTTLPAVVARGQDPSVVQQQRPGQACLHCYPQRFVSVVSITASALDGGTLKASLGLYSLQFNLVTVLNHYFRSLQFSGFKLMYRCLWVLLWKGLASRYQHKAGSDLALSVPLLQGAEPILHFVPLR